MISVAEAKQSRLAGCSLLARIAVAGWREAVLRAGYCFRLWRNGGWFVQAFVQ